MARIAFVVLACILLETFNFAYSADQPDDPAAALPTESALDIREEPNANERAGFRPSIPVKGSVSLRPHPVPVTPNSNFYNRLECYACTDCPEVTQYSPLKLCPYTLDPLKQNRCVVYSEKYQHMKEPIYIRGCASERSTCAEIKRAHSQNDIVSLVTCSECVGDRCNTNDASRSIFDHTMAFFVIIVAPLATKFTLS